MTDRLFDLPAEPRLTERQQRALDLIAAAGWEGLRTDELGAALHYPRHGLNERCGWCTSAGHQMGDALRAKKLVRQRKREANDGAYMVWTTADAKPPVRNYELPVGF